ncbi:MAG: DUF4034 domain-containing protein [Deltaproteobacteria bacterium]|nr:DUF4034 domain-containing protein [Deltaproteobacteria bacterium]
MQLKETVSWGMLFVVVTIASAGSFARAEPGNFTKADRSADAPNSGFEAAAKAVKPDVSQPIVVDGPVIREKLQRDVQALLYTKRFAELETLAGRLRAAKERFPEGHWKLMYFYWAFKKPLGNRPNKWDRHFKVLEQWRQAFPQSVTARIATAEAWLSYGWEARGEGYASSVSDQGWELLKERVAKAYALVKDAPVKGEPDCPGRYDLLLTIGKVEGWPPERYIGTFQAAVRCEPEYIQFYASTMDYLSPKWQGDEESWIAFIEQADTIAGKPESRELYARLMVGMWRDTWTSYDDLRVSWTKMKKGYRDMERRFPGSQYNLNNFAKFACVAGDAEVGRELFQKIGDAPYFDVWDRKGLDFEQCRKKFGVSGLTRKEIYLGRKNQEAVQMRILAEQGDVFSQLGLAKDYSKGEVGKVQDHALAFKFAKSAAEKGYVPAQAWLGLMYFSGKGVNTDKNTGIQLLENAAKQGDNEGMFYLPHYLVKQNKHLESLAWLLVSKDKKWAQEMIPVVEKTLTPEEIESAKQKSANIVSIIDSNQ